MEVLNQVLPAAYGVAGRCVGIAQGALYALQSARDSIFSSKAKDAGADQDASAGGSPRGSPGKKQRLRSPEPLSPEKEQDAQTQTADNDVPEAIPSPQHEQPAQEKQQQPAESEQPKQTQDPTPAEAFTEAEKVDAAATIEVTKLEDITGVRQPEELYVTAAAKPVVPVAQKDGDNTSSEGDNTPTSTASAPRADDTKINGGGGGQKKRSKSKKRKGSHK